MQRNWAIRVIAHDLTSHQANGLTTSRTLYGIDQKQRSYMNKLYQARTNKDT